MKRFKLLAGVAALAAASASIPAQALTFVLTPAAGAAGAGVAQGTLARRGFEIAAAYWSSVLTSNATVNLTIGYGALGTGILASTGSTTAVVFNSATYSALAANATSSVDAAAVASLRPLGTSAYGTQAVSVVTNALNATNTGYVNTSTRVDNDASINNVATAMNTSVAKALGVTSDANGNAINYGAQDGSITFSNLFNFDFDPTDGIASDAFDFIGVAIHEIGHALGFRSGVDVYDAYTAPGSSTTRTGALENVVVGTTLDLFRYSSAGTLNWSTQGSSYFSIDGGVSQVYGDSRFEMGVANGGRSRQASHFYDSIAGVPQIGVMDPTSGYGQMQDVTALDIAAFDAIGWRTAFDANFNQGYRMNTAAIYRQFAVAGVPETSTWLMMILGFGAIGFGMRRRNTKVAVTYA